MPGRRALEGDRGQLGAGRPSLGELVEPVELVVGHGDLVEGEEVGQLVGHEAQLVAAQLQQLAAQAQAGE